MFDGVEGGRADGAKRRGRVAGHGDGRRMVAGTVDWVGPGVFDLRVGERAAPTEALRALPRVRGLLAVA